MSELNLATHIRAYHNDNGRFMVGFFNSKGERLEAHELRGNTTLSMAQTLLSEFNAKARAKQTQGDLELWQD